MATNIFSHWTVYAAYTMEEWRLEGPLNINFLAIFLHFPNPYIKWNQKSLGEQGKVENCVKWVTLMYTTSHIQKATSNKANSELSFSAQGTIFDLNC